MKKITRKRLLEQLHGTALWIKHVSIHRILEVDDTLPVRFQEVLKSCPYLKDVEVPIWFIREEVPSRQGGKAPLDLAVYNPKRKHIYWIASGLTTREAYKILTTFVNTYEVVFTTL